MSVGDSPSATNPYMSPVERTQPVVPSERTADLLRQTRPWVRLMGVLGFISIGFMVLGAVAMLILSVVSGPGGGFPIAQAILMAVMYGVMAILYIFPSLFLLRYASRISDFLDQGTTAALDAALEAQKAFWKFVGIMVAVILGFYAIAIVVGLIFGIVGALSMR